MRASILTLMYNPNLSNSNINTSQFELNRTDIENCFLVSLLVKNSDLFATICYASFVRK